MEAVEVSELEEEEEEAETDPSFLLRSWMPSWMLTMPRCVLLLRRRIFTLYLDDIDHVIMMFLIFQVSDGHQLEALR